MLPSPLSVMAPKETILILHTSEGGYSWPKQISLKVRERSPQTLPRCTTEVITSHQEAAQGPRGGNYGREENKNEKIKAAFTFTKHLQPARSREEGRDE